METATSDPALDALWDAYIKAEQAGLRSTAMEALERFIAALGQREPPLMEAWTHQLVRELADGGGRVPVRYPLLRDVLAPVLARGVIARKPGCARWLAFLVEGNVRLEGVLDSLPEHLRTHHALLLEALQVDANDRRARHALVAELSNYFRYTLHELPAGVLLDHDGATADGCSEMLASLGDFKNHVRTLGEEGRYADLIANCEYHYHAYREYLTSRGAGDYAAFLAERGWRLTKSCS